MAYDDSHEKPQAFLEVAISRDGASPTRSRPMRKAIERGGRRGAQACQAVAAAQYSGAQLCRVTAAVGRNGVRSLRRSDEGDDP